MYIVSTYMCVLYVYVCVYTEMHMSRSQQKLKTLLNDFAWVLGHLHWCNSYCRLADGKHTTRLSLYVCTVPT